MIPEQGVEAESGFKNFIPETESHPELPKASKRSFVTSWVTMDTCSIRAPGFQESLLQPRRALGTVLGATKLTKQ